MGGIICPPPPVGVILRPLPVRVLGVLTPQCDTQRKFQGMHSGRKVPTGHPENIFHDDTITVVDA